MIRLECDSGEVERHLGKLAGLIERHGGLLDKRLVIRCRDGNFSLHGKDNSAANRWLARLPPACLLPVKQFELTVAEEGFCIASHTAELSGGRLELLEVFLALLNETGKAASLRESVPAMLKLDDPGLYARLAEGRAQPEAEAKPAGPGQLLVDTLVKSRAIAKGIDGHVGEPDVVFMPLIDFANHHPLAPAFGCLIEPGGQHLLALMGFFPVAGTMECFVRYSEYDAYDAFMHYGYVERNACFVRSIPMEIDLPGLGRIKLRASATPVMHKIVPPDMAHLAPFVPKITADREAGVVDVGFLLIPRQSTQPMALRHVLAIVLSQLDPKLTRETGMGYVEMAEEQLLAGNVSYYKGLRDYLDKLEPARRDRYPVLIQAAREMIRVQQAILANYLIFRHTLEKSGAAN